MPETWTGWTREDSLAASAEGWDVFENDERGFEIERCDDADVFDGDLSAIMHVRDQSRTGSALHLKALAVVGETVKGDMLFAHAYMRALDGLADPYVIESIRLPSGVIIRAKQGPGLDVIGHNAFGVYVVDADREPAIRFHVPADKIDQITVLAL